MSVIQFADNASERRLDWSVVKFKLKSKRLYMNLVVENANVPIAASGEFKRVAVTVESLNSYIPRMRDCEAIYNSILKTLSDGEKRSIYYSVVRGDGVEPRRIDLVKNFKDAVTGSICKTPWTITGNDISEKAM